MESKRESVITQLDESLLLIEPVWNRNVVACHPEKISRRAFNRTSMESKLAKPSPNKDHSHRLLIEPVWNRNAVVGTTKTAIHHLLIELVWNRNRFAVLFLTRKGVLLIEPVWNRNLLETSMTNNSQKQTRF